MLETEFLKLKYHDNVESNTDEVDAEEYFNNNYKKIDANAKKQNEDLIKLKEDLEQENTELSSNMPWNTIQGKSLHITDSAKYSKNKLEISGDMEQKKRSGKNKFKIPESATNNGVTLTKNADGSFTLNGTTTGVTVFNATLNKPLKAGTYTLSYKSSVALGNSFFLRVRDENMILVNSAKPVSQVQGNGTSSVASYTTSVEAAIVAINLTQTGVTYNNVVIYAQLEEGTTATEFEKYGATPSTEFPSMPVICTGVQKISQFGKNWLNIKKGTVTAHGLTVTIDNQNVIHINGTVNTSAYPWLYISKDTLKIMQGTPSESTTVFTDKNLVDGDFTISFKYNGKYYDGAKHIYNNTKYVGAVNPYNYDNVRSFNSGMNGITIYLGEKGQVFTNATIEIMINKGIVKEQYEPYTEEINTLDLNTTELCAIKDTNGNVVAKDRHVFRNGKWQWEKIIKKRVLNGTENWTDDTVSTVKHFRGKLDNLTYSKTNNAYCDKFICRTSEAHGEWEYIYIIGKACFINIDNTKLTEVSLNGFKTWLSNNNVTVYYVLATPEYIDCTAEQSAILDKLHSNFALQKGTNNIIVESSNGVGVNLELEYMQDLQAKLNSLEAMCVSNASQEV